MFFAKDEVIELEEGMNYLVLGAVIVDNEIFYQIQAVDEQTQTLTGAKSIIKAINDQGELYIEDIIEPDKLTKLEESFAS